MKNIQQLTERLISSKIVTHCGNLSGCTAQEMTQIENVFGCLNEDYKNILGLMGHRAGLLLDPYEYAFYYERLFETNRVLRRLEQESIQDCVEEGVDIDFDTFPADFFVISARYGGDWPHFIKTQSKDSTVYVRNDEGEIKPAFPSVWQWIEDFVIAAEAILALHRKKWIEHLSRYFSPPLKY